MAIAELGQQAYEPNLSQETLLRASQIIEIALTGKFLLWPEGGSMFPLCAADEEPPLTTQLAKVLKEHTVHKPLIFSLAAHRIYFPVNHRPRPATTNELRELWGDPTGPTDSSRVVFVLPGIRDRITYGENGDIALRHSDGKSLLASSEKETLTTALEALVEKTLKTLSPDQAHQVVTDYLRSIAAINTPDYQNPENQSQAITNEENIVIDPFPEREVEVPERRIYRGKLVRVGPDDALFERDAVPEAPYSTDYYDAEANKAHVNQFLIFTTTPGAFAQSPATLKENAVIRGETFEDDLPINVDRRAAKVTKLKAYSISTLPIQSEQDEQIIRLVKKIGVKKFGLTPAQIASKLHVSVTTVETRIAAINEAFQQVTHQTERKFLE